VNSQTDPGSCLDSIAIPFPITEDNHSVKSVINDYNGSSDASDYYPAGTTFVRWTVEDMSGNSTYCTQSITVEDKEEPEILCSPDTIAYLNDSCEYTVPDFIHSTTVQDNCDQGPVLTQIPLQGSILQGAGTAHEIILTARDESGNESICTFNILLIDNTPPLAISLLDTTIVVSEGVFEANVIIDPPEFFDNCGIETVVNNFNGGTDASGIYRYGTTTVMYTVTDVNSNTATFDQQVVVELENGPEHGLIIPEAFSPNEDGLNDRFEILGIEQYPENELAIFNVHGIEVFRMPAYDNSWDGTTAAIAGNQNKLPTGTYYYIIKLKPGGMLVRGFIYLRKE
jgi:gliding motility-associated-like protein